MESFPLPVPPMGRDGGIVCGRGVFGGSHLYRFQNAISSISSDENFEGFWRSSLRYARGTMPAKPLLNGCVGQSATFS